MSTDRKGSQRAAGFTLLETVVALLIVALGMTAVYMQLHQVTVNSIYLREKTLASWIGSNIVTEHSLQTEWPALGDREEELEYAGVIWILTIEVSETQVENLRRIDVSVAREERPDEILHTVSGLIEPPLAPEFPPVDWRRASGGQRG